jgi:hypothetical protein
MSKRNDKAHALLILKHRNNYGWLLAALCLLLLVLAHTSVHAAVTAQVDRDTINEGETFTLNLNVSGSNSSQPDLSALHQDFDVLGTGQKSMIQIINGSIQSNHSWSITLSPKRSGKLIIPSIRVGSESSNALAVTVLPASASTAGNGNLGDVFIEVSAKPEHSYVQAQLLYTVRLYYATPLRQGTLSKPSLDNAIVQKLGDDSNFDTQRGGRQYQVIERRYAIFPQRSGKLEIPSVVFDGDVTDPSAQSGDPFFDSFNPVTRHVHLRSRKLEIQVAAQPAGYQGSNWLPAQDITLKEKWSTPNPQFRVGEPVTRDIIIQAKGLASSQLPDLPLPNVDGLKLYPDQAQTSDKAQGDTLVSEREQKIAMIPTRAGDLTLPAVHLTWWDTTTQQQRTTSLPAETIHVLPGTSVSNSTDYSNTTAQPSTPVQTTPAPTATTTAKAQSNAINTNTSGPQPSRLWIVASVFFALAWLITLLLWWRNKQTPPAATTQGTAATPEQDGEKRVKQACQQNDPQAVKRALLAWAKQHWSATPPLSLGALAALVNDAALANEIQILDKLLYAASAADWQATPLLQHFSAYLKQTHKREKPAHAALAPLHLHKTRAASK